jgi:ribonuclease BN (tRNA processing enzyme)
VSRFVRIEKCGHAIDTRHRCGWALHRSLQSISHRLPFYVPTGRTILEALPNHRQKRVHVPALRLEFTHTHRHRQTFEERWPRWVSRASSHMWPARRHRLRQLRPVFLTARHLRRCSSYLKQACYPDEPFSWAELNEYTRYEE